MTKYTVVLEVSGDQTIDRITTLFNYIIREEIKHHLNLPLYEVRAIIEGEIDFKTRKVSK
jgi:hypothetical protein